MKITEQNPRIAELRRRAEQGDRFALRALRFYRTDAELERAEREAKDTDLTDGGCWPQED